MEFLFHLFLVLLLSWQHAIAHDCRDYIYFMPGFQLHDHVIHTKVTTDHEECRESCRKNDACFSINFKQNESQCELNSASHMTHPRRLRPEVNAFYALVKPPTNCSNEYCSTGKKCVLQGKRLRYKCEDCVDVALGMESLAISDSAITASSFLEPSYEPYYARLNSPRGAVGRGWVPSHNTAGGFLQIDLGRLVVVTRVATQGRRDYPQWVKTYKIKYSIDFTTWQAFQENGGEKVFTGNTDHTTVVYQLLPSPVVARGFQFLFITFKDRPALRVELYGTCM
ncbi:lactadherin [Nematostella vectensis]|uniref:lactadherin n=1 Tax=Nematostella vectensis TaxID=45351 RepID=UPI0020775BF9|nr:lactadherin [Nematostella vectensis]